MKAQVALCEVRQLLDGEMVVDALEFLHLAAKYKHRSLFTVWRGRAQALAAFLCHCLGTFLLPMLPCLVLGEFPQYLHNQGIMWRCRGASVH
jgi:hypothetical protein